MLLLIWLSRFFEYFLIGSICFLDLNLKIFSLLILLSILIFSFHYLKKYLKKEDFFEVKFDYLECQNFNCFSSFLMKFYFLYCVSLENYFIIFVFLVFFLFSKKELVSFIKSPGIIFLLFRYRVFKVKIKGFSYYIFSKKSVYNLSLNYKVSLVSDYILLLK